MQMRNRYGELRATIERIVEKTVFAGVVSRFSSYLNLKNLSEVVNFPKTEHDEIHRIFKKCSDVITGHDPANGGWFWNPNRRYRITRAENGRANRRGSN